MHFILGIERHLFFALDLGVRAREETRTRQAQSGVCAGDVFGFSVHGKFLSLKERSSINITSLPLVPAVLFLSPLSYLQRKGVA